MSGSGRIYRMGGTQDNGCFSAAPLQPVPTVGSSRAYSMMGKVSSQESQAVSPPMVTSGQGSITSSLAFFSIDPAGSISLFKSEKEEKKTSK